MESESRFSDTHKVGSGTYGVVFSAYDNELKRNVAIKKIKLENETEGIPSTTLRELSILQELSHESIVELLDIICEDGRIQIIFELCRTDLKNYIYDEHTKKFVNHKIVKSIMWQLMQGMDYCHKNRIFHRDLKPNNVLIDDVDGKGEFLSTSD